MPFNRIRPFMEREYLIEGEALSTSVLTEALEMYHDSGREAESKDPEDQAFFNECLKRAFNQILNRSHEHYIRIETLEGLSLMEKGRIKELMDKHKKDPTSLSPKEIDFIINNTMVVLSEKLIVPEEEESPEPEEPEDEPAEAMRGYEQNPDIEPDGAGEFENMTERRFAQWLNHKGYPWHYFNQTQGTYPKVYRGKIKRSDFEVLTPLGKRILVDVKYRWIYPFKGSQNVSLDEHGEIIKYRNYRKIWPDSKIWFAFTIEEDSDHPDFYWIDFNTVLTFEPKNSRKSKEPARFIPLSECIRVSWDEDLYKVLLNKDDPAVGTSPKLVGIPLPILGL